MEKVQTCKMKKKVINHLKYLKKMSSQIEIISTFYIKNLVNLHVSPIRTVMKVCCHMDIRIKVCQFVEEAVIFHCHR